MKKGQIHHVEYYVNDLERSNAFWGWLFELMGWSAPSHFSNSHTNDQGTEWTHPDGTYIVFVKVKPDHQGYKNNRQAAGLNHISFNYESNVPQSVLAQQLVDRGAQIVYNEENYLCFEDVNGFAIELYF